MPRFQGKRVSRAWRTVLTEADRHIDFQLNSGRRTMREQWALWRAYRAGRGNLAAFPSPFAPHIRKGFPNHALDVDSWNDGENKLQRWLRRHGAPATNTVVGEAWHLEAPLRGLLKLTRRIRRQRKRRR